MSEAKQEAVAAVESRVWGRVAEFETPDQLIAAAKVVRDAGFARWDCHTPFPVHGLDGAMGVRATKLPWAVLAAGLTGCTVALLLQWWTNGVDYPMEISGKPLFGLPAAVPVAFELTILLSALTVFFGVLVLGGLPSWHHPLFGKPRFARATSDRFFLVIEASDPLFDEADRVLAGVDAASVEDCVEECRVDGSDARLPRAIKWAGVFAIVIALLPFAWIAKKRVTTTTSPRIEIFDDMDFQPKLHAQGSSTIFADGRAMRAQVAGTVARGELRNDPVYFEGKNTDGSWAETVPVRPSLGLLARGQQSYNIHCAVCHGRSGYGDGPISKRAAALGEPAWVPPTSLHDDVVRKRKVGQLFDAITNGVRTMPAYSSIDVADRWAIVLYLHALQRSQNAKPADVPAELRDGLK